MSTANLSLEQRAVGAYIGLAVGDALGATVEFMTPREIQHQYGVHKDIRGGGWLRLKPGQVTDDTTMALALGDSVLANGPGDARSHAHAFDAWMRAKPVDIGNTVRRGLLHFRKNDDPVCPPSEAAAGNGACMRLLPVVLATLNADETVVGTALRAQAHVTHNNSLSDAAGDCLAAMLRGALSGETREELRLRYATTLVELQPLYAFEGRKVTNPSAYIVDTIRAVFQALFSTENFRDCLVDVVNRGGDADTTGAIAGMIAGALYGIEAIPGKWRAAIDPAIAARCERQALKLVQLAD